MGSNSKIPQTVNPNEMQISSDSDEEILEILTHKTNSLQININSDTKSLLVEKITNA